MLPTPFKNDVSRCLLAGVLTALACRAPQTTERDGSHNLPEMTVAPTEDFELSGDGSAPSWERAEWVRLDRRGGDGLEYETRVKVLYSATGLYVLMDGADARITATMTEDFLDLWHEDVFEVFLWTDEAYPVYFEYEISPLGYELPILIPNFGGEFLGWRPWHYEGERRTRRATAAIGGPREPGATVTGWRAEVFIPWALLEPLQGVPPGPGAVWRANFYRVDYDGATPTAWHWAPVAGTFHEFTRFGVLRFAPMGEAGAQGGPRARRYGTSPTIASRPAPPRPGRHE